jgi:dTDP-4-amino-4,6-dideoxygalactose transaminase
MLRDWGQDRKYHPTLKGYNYRLQGIQAAVLRVKLRRLEAWTEARRAKAAFYDRTLIDSGLTLPLTLPNVRHVYHLYTVRCEHRDDLQKELSSAGISTAVHYPFPIHLLPAYSDPRYTKGAFPVSEACAQTALSLPVHPFLTSEQQQYISETVCEKMGRLETCPQ